MRAIDLAAYGFDRSVDHVRVNIPGTATALVRVALVAGLHFDDPGLLLLSAGSVLPTSWIAHSYWLL